MFGFHPHPDMYTAAYSIHNLPSRLAGSGAVPFPWSDVYSPVEVKFTQQEELFRSPEDLSQLPMAE